jgi:hypothetical protein
MVALLITHAPREPPCWRFRDQSDQSLPRLSPGMEAVASSPYGPLAADASRERRLSRESPCEKMDRSKPRIKRKGAVA